MPEQAASPRVEATGLLALVQRGEPVAAVRTLIGDTSDTTAYRRAVRLYFDGMVARLPRRGMRLRQRVRETQVSDLLKLQVIQLLRLGWSQKRIRNTLHVGVGPGIIMKLSKKIGAAFLKQRGRGRRFTPEMKQRIRDAVKAGKRSAAIQREFQIDYDTTILFRREFGDFEDRRHWTKLSSQQIARAREALMRGEKWRSVAIDSGVALATLQRHVTFRKRGTRRERDIAA